MTDVRDIITSDSIVALIDCEALEVTVFYRDAVLDTSSTQAMKYITQKWERVYISNDRLFSAWMPRNGGRALAVDGSFKNPRAWFIQCGVGEKLGLIENERRLNEQA